MNEAIVARRYAKSLIEISEEKGKLEAVYEDMQRILQGCRNMKDLRRLLKSPLIKTDKKIYLLKTIFEEHINPVTLDFILLITHNKREAFLEEISIAFIEKYKEIKNIVTAEVKSAIPLDEPARKKS